MKFISESRESLHGSLKFQYSIPLQRLSDSKPISIFSGKPTHKWRYPRAWGKIVGTPSTEGCNRQQRPEMFEKKPKTEGMNRSEYIGRSNHIFDVRRKSCISSSGLA